MKQNLQTPYTLYEGKEALPEEDQALLELAIKATRNAYAPYSKFFVGAAALLQNGKTITGTNQENASYPVGICAERVLLSAASVVHPNVPIVKLAVTYHNTQGISNKPISPCGICRQSLLEYEDRMGCPITLIMGGETGKIIVLDTVSQLLPFSFSGADL